MSLLTVIEGHLAEAGYPLGQIGVQVFNINADHRGTARGVCMVNVGHRPEILEPIAAMLVAAGFRAEPAGGMVLVRWAKRERTAS